MRMRTRHLNSPAAAASSVDIDEAIRDLLSSSPKHRAKAWIIGRQINGTISSTIFGQFTKNDSPPSEGWLYMGRNLEYTASDTVEDYEIVNGHVFTDEAMVAAKDDQLEVHSETLLDESLLGCSTSPEVRMTTLYTVSGCSLKVINGRYYPCGMECGVTKYRLASHQSAQDHLY